MNDNVRSAEIMTEMLVRRARGVMQHGGSVEQLLAATDRAVLAAMPIDARTPDQVANSIYHAVADGTVGAAWANAAMDRHCVVHTDYAWRWMQHAMAAERGHSLEQTAGAEILDLIDEPHWNRLPDLDAFDAVA